MSDKKHVQHLKIQYPKTVLWDKNPRRIKFINPGDFRKGHLLNTLGLGLNNLSGSLGITDMKEILKRQSLIKFFIKNTKLIKFFTKNRFTQAILPEGSDEFLEHFDPKREHGPFWTLVNEVTEMINKRKRVPEEIRSIIDFITGTRERVEKGERDLTGRIAKEILKATYIEGVIDFPLVYADGATKKCFTLLHPQDHEGVPELNVYGYKKYSFGLAKGWKIYPPEWADKFLWKWTGIRDLVNTYCKIRNKIRKRTFHSPLIIRELPLCICNEILEFLNERINKIEFPDTSSKDNVFLRISFRYSDIGLRITLLSVITTGGKPDNITDTNMEDIDEFVKEDFPGYSRRKLKKIRKMHENFRNQRTNIRTYIHSQKVMKVLENEFPSLIGNMMIGIKSPETDEDYKWFSLEYLYEKSAFKSSVKNAKKYREYFRNQMLTLKDIAIIANTFIEKSREWKMPLRFPEILGNGKHMISFEELFPIHLIGQKNSSGKVLGASDIKPITSLPSIGKKLIGFTGQCGGGKSATKETIVDDIFLAQSGLPVFGKEFKLNVKETVGLMFIERGPGSTLELLLNKARNILEFIEHNEVGGNNIVLVLDEVGTGTQETAGEEYGKMLLKKLHGYGISIIFSTQITDLARFARNELGAECFAFDLKHQIKPGIGKGGIENLMEKVGITGFFK